MQNKTLDNLNKEILKETYDNEKNIILGSTSNNNVLTYICLTYKHINNNIRKRKNI